ncbi:MAG: hypothetical protein AAGJ35_12355, partial [Myxococcota bacterium]
EPKQAAALIALGTFAKNRGRYPQADRLLRLALHYRSSSNLAWFHLGHVHLILAKIAQQKSNTDKTFANHFKKHLNIAKKCFSNNIELATNDPRPHWGIAHIHGLQDKSQQQEKIFRQWLKHPQARSYILRDLLKLLKAQKRQREFRTLLRKHGTRFLHDRSITHMLKQANMLRVQKTSNP